MARLFSTGFELNDTTNNREFDSISGFTIQTSVVRSGVYAGQANVSASTATVRQVLFTSNQAIKGFMRLYIRIVALPSAAIQIMRFENTANSSLGAIRLNTNGTLNLLNAAGAAIGNASGALSLNADYCVELGTDATGAGALTGRIGGLVFATGANSAQGQWARVAFGGFGTSSTFNLVFDDVAVNDDSGSFQNTWPGEGKILLLKPTAAGDANGFATAQGGTAGAANNYTRVQELPFDDATTYNASGTLAAEDLFNLTNAGLLPTDTVNVVMVGGRFANITGADAATAFKFEAMKTSGGTKAQSPAIIPNSTTWRFNATATPWKYPLILYQDPDGANWSNATIDSMQIGYTISAANTNPIAVSTLLALVEYVPAANTTNFLQFM